MRALSLFGFLLMGCGLIGLIVIASLFSWSPPAIVAQSGAVGIWLWARVAFGRRSFHVAADPTRGNLIQSGPYRYVRHPIYAAVCLFAWAGALAHHSFAGLALAVVLTAGAVIRITCEERLLAERYADYGEYMRATKRLVPFVF